MLKRKALMESISSNLHSFLKEIGKINDKGIGTGRFRALTKTEISYLKKVTMA
jgi:hypothetical protein